MASATYENILLEVEQLTAEEQHRLRDELTERVERPLQNSPAEFVAYLRSFPFDEMDRLDIDRMEQAIEEGCERIEPNT